MDKLPRRGVYYIEDHKEVGGVNRSSYSRGMQARTAFPFRRTRIRIPKPCAIHMPGCEKNNGDQGFEPFSITVTN